MMLPFILLQGAQKTSVANLLTVGNTEPAVPFLIANYVFIVTITQSSSLVELRWRGSNNDSVGADRIIK